MERTSKQLPCDQCHERRVRCRDRGNGPCEACFSSRTECTRTLVRKKRGPKKASANRESGLALNRVSRVASDQSKNESAADGIGNVDRLLQTEGTSPSNLHRGVLQPSSGLDQHATISELADLVLNQAPLDGVDSVHTWAQSSAQSKVESPLARQPPIVSPRPSDQEGAFWRAASTPTLSDGQGVLFRSLSVSSDALTLDGPSLASSVGLPVRYASTILDAVDIYFGKRLYHVLPIIHEPSFRKLLSRPSQLSQAQRCFVLAFCAAAILRDACRFGETIEEDTKERGTRFIEQCLTLRANIDFIEEKSPLMVTMSYFIHLSYACLDKVRSSGHFLREAISFGMGLGLSGREQPSNSHDAELISARRTLALLSVTERAMAVLIDVPAILLRIPPPVPAVFFDEEDSDTLIAFDCLYSLFSLLNPDILDFWSRDRLENDQHRETLRVMIEAAQLELANRSFEKKPLTDSQRADILVTQQWLRLILWQISNRLTLLSTFASNAAFTYDYPIQISKDLCGVLKTLTEESIQAHHFSIYSKIFEIAYSLMDVLVYFKRQKDTSGSGELRLLFGILANSPVSRMGFSKILMEKTRTQGP